MDVSVSTPQLLTALVEEAVSVGSLVRLLQFQGGAAHLVEITLAEDSPANDIAIADLDFPRDAVVVAVVRADRLIVPRGDTTLQSGDEVLVLVTAAARTGVHSLLIIDERPGNRARATRSQPGCGSCVDPVQRYAVFAT